MRKLLGATALALIVPAVASAHITIQPSFVEDGVETEISFQTPNERPPNETISLHPLDRRGHSLQWAITAEAAWQFLNKTTVHATWRPSPANPTGANSGSVGGL